MVTVPSVFTVRAPKVTFWPLALSSAQITEPTISIEVSASSEEIAASTGEMKLASSEVASAAEVLNDVTKEMIEHVNQFKI